MENSMAFPKPVKIIHDNVPAREVGEYYLRAELSRMVHTEAGQKEIAKYLQDQPDQGFWDLLAGLSLTCRHNWVFWEVSNEKYRWRLDELRVEDIHLSGMGHGTEMTALIHSKDVNHDPRKLRTKLADFHAGRHEGLPDYLGTFVPGRKVAKKHRSILVRERTSSLSVLDGMNRFIQHLANGAETVTAYRAVDQGVPSRSRVGEGVILQLRELYLATEDADSRKHIAGTVEHIRRSAVDGEYVVKRRWDEKNLPTA